MSKRNRGKKKASWTVVFLVCMAVLSVVLCTMCITKCNSQQTQIRGLQSAVASLQDQNVRKTSVSDLELEFYRELSDKTDAAISQIYTIVGICLTVFSLFGLLIAFKAPNELENEMQELKEEVEKSKKYARDSEEYSRLLSATMADTTWERIEQLSDFIAHYPENNSAYMMRGFQYLENKEPDKAISDFNIGRKVGESKKNYYYAMGLAMRQKDEHKKAVEYFTHAIKLQPSAHYYYSRACDYAEMNQFEDSLKDFDSAIEIESETYRIYYNRSLVYKRMVALAKTDEEMLEYERKRIVDLKHAEEINPENEIVQRAIRIDIREIRNSDEMSALQLVRINTYVKIEEERANRFATENKIENAIQSYDKVLKLIYYRSKEEFADAIGGIGEKIAALYLFNTKNKRIFKHYKMIAMVTSENLSRRGVTNYSMGNKDEAEELFIDAIELLETRDDARIDLAFMRRRNETTRFQSNCIELLDQCSEETKKSSFWVFNYVLALLKEKHNYDEVIRYFDDVEEVNKALSWWCKTELLGDEEYNIILLLLDDNRVEYDEVYSNGRDMEARRKKAIEDGFLDENVVLNSDVIMI